MQSPDDESPHLLYKNPESDHYLNTTSEKLKHSTMKVLAIVSLAVICMFNAEVLSAPLAATASPDDLTELLANITEISNHINTTCGEEYLKLLEKEAEEEFKDENSSEEEIASESSEEDSDSDSAESSEEDSSSDSAESSEEDSSEEDNKRKRHL